MNEAEAIGRRWFKEVWNEGRAEVIDELLAPGCVAWHEPRQSYRGPQGTKAFFAKQFGAFDQASFRLVEVFGKDDKAVIWWEATMRHSAPGWQSTAPTGATIIVPGMTAIRVADGKIVEGWDFWDRDDVTAQIKAGGTSARA